MNRDNTSRDAACPPEEQSEAVEKPTKTQAGNDKIIELYGAEPQVGEVSLFCECSDPNCHRILALTLTEFEHVRHQPGRYVTLPHHLVEDATTEFKTTRYWLQQRTS